MPVELIIATSVIGWLVSPLISKLYDKALEYLGDEKTAERISRLKRDVLPRIEAVIDVAEMTPISHKLELWLTDLKAAAHDVEGLMEELDQVETQNSEQKGTKRRREDGPEVPSNGSHSSGSSPLNDNQITRRKISKSQKKDLSKKVDKLLAIADQLDSYVSVLNLYINSSKTACGVSMNWYVSVSSFVPPFYGRGELCNKLIPLLINKDADTEEPVGNEFKIPLIPICGIGGSGKTTLVQHVFSNNEVKGHFGDCRMWVHVSRRFDLLTVTRKIIESATRDKCPGMENINALQDRLAGILRTKRRFLLVLDDVWCEDWRSKELLDQLLAPLQDVDRKECRILITTRTKRAASALGSAEPVCLDELDVEPCKSVIEYYAFGGSGAGEAALANLINEKIVDKIKRSPLAAKMLGNQLRSHRSPDSWNEILKEDILKDCIDYLMKTFRHLPWSLQQCFAFCSLVPRGWQFELDDLVKLWNQKGLIDRRVNGQLRSSVVVGRQYFDDLLSYMFIQQVDPNEVKHGKLYVVHGLLHELAERVTRDTCCRIEEESGPVPRKVVNVSITAAKPGEVWDKLNCLKKLQTIVIVGEKSLFDEYDADKKLKRVKKLYLKTPAIFLASKFQAHRKIIMKQDPLIDTPKNG